MILNQIFSIILLIVLAPTYYSNREYSKIQKHFGYFQEANKDGNSQINSLVV